MYTTRVNRTVYGDLSAVPIFIRYPDFGPMYPCDFVAIYRNFAALYYAAAVRQDDTHSTLHPLPRPSLPHSHIAAAEEPDTLSYSNKLHSLVS